MDEYYCEDPCCYFYQPCPIHDAIVLKQPAPAPLVSTLGGETILFEDNFDGCLLTGWNWVREDKNAWRCEEHSLAIKAKPGGIWGSFFSDNLAANFLLRPVPEGCTAFEATVKLRPSGYGEQGGLFWMYDDNNYVKLVVEGMKDGSVAIVLARYSEANGSAAVINKVPIESGVFSLRLELSPCGEKISGLLDTGYCMRLIGSCDAKTLLSHTLALGLGAHGGSAEGSGWAQFSSFRCLRIAPNRVQFGASRPLLEEGSIGDTGNPDPEEEILYAPETPQPGGWVFSSALSAAERANIQGMLAAQGLTTT